MNRTQNQAELESLMRHAYKLAHQAAARGDHPFSALLVVDGEVVLECLNAVHSSADATRHPELDILRLGAEKLGQAALRDATLVASTEPCAMCTGAIYRSGIKRVIYGCPTEALASVASGRFVLPSRELLARSASPKGQCRRHAEILPGAPRYKKAPPRAGLFCIFVRKGSSLRQ